MLAYKTCSIHDYSELAISKFLDKIPLSKRAKILAYKIPKRQTQSIVSEMILKELLEQHTNILYDNLEYTYNNNGKPYIKNNPIFFNISHSSEYVSVVIADREVGVDIQEVKNNITKACKYICTNDEYQYLLKQNDHSLSTYVYACKEAYIKKNGLSLKNIQVPLFDIIDNQLHLIRQEDYFKEIHACNYYKNVICIGK